MAEEKPKTSVAGLASVSKLPADKEPKVDPDPQGTLAANPKITDEPAGSKYAMLVECGLCFHQTRVAPVYVDKSGKRCLPSEGSYSKEATLAEAQALGKQHSVKHLRTPF